jgi:ribose 5-phosphate isomerase A
MASIASSSSLSTGFLLHSFTPQLNSRRRWKMFRPNFVRIMPTRSCLDDTSSLLQAAQYTVCINFQFIILSKFLILFG